MPRTPVLGLLDGGGHFGLSEGAGVTVLCLPCLDGLPCPSPPQGGARPHASLATLPCARY
ncbi:hypothetical protein E2C01_100260 [Portunus trituberculatus]|uniref:Uncharacterized protein n=1 Tax=Portunus trituberculatus TaxID=210409 RepID=A0A5B7KCK5_PORTR|nr:hypothetical protein [Portunus trituberculatus]